MASKLGQKRPRTPLVVPSRRYCRGNDPSSLLNCYNIIFQLGTFKTSSLFQTCCSVAQPQRIVLLCVSLKSRGIPAYPRFGLREHFAFRHFLFSGLFLLSWVILFHFLFCSSCGTMELGWVQQLLLFAPVGCSGQWSRGKEGGGRDWRKANMHRPYFSHAFRANQLGDDERGGRRKGKKNGQNKQDGRKIV